MRDLGSYIASGKATSDESNLAIDCLALAAACICCSHIRYGASDGFQEIFLSNNINGAELIDQSLQQSEAFQYLGKSQKDLLALILQDATNEYVGNHRERCVPGLDDFSGKIFAVSFGKQDVSRKLSLKQ